MSKIQFSLDYLNQSCVDFKLIHNSENIPPERQTERDILRLVTLYRDVICKQLRDDANLYKLPPITPPPSEPYTNMCACYIGSVMHDIGKFYPLYVCEITISNIKNLLDNIVLKHFYYENENGIPFCQIRKIDIVSGSTIGPISVDKLV